METTYIEVNDNKIGLRFGVWVIGQLIKNEGLDLSNLGEHIKADPISFYANILYYGALWFHKRSKDEDKGDFQYDKDDTYEWIDELGGLNSKDVQKVQSVFLNSISEDVPKSKKKATKKE